MSRNISQTALQALLSEETDEQFLVTLKIAHSNLSEPLQFVNDTQDLVKADGTYIAWPFQIQFPSDTEENIPKVRVTIDNVDQKIIREIRAMEESPDITIEIVLRSQPNTPELGPFTMELKSADYDQLQISGNIGYESDFLNEKFPARKFTPKTAQGQFA